MEIIVEKVDDETPKGLTTGFRLKLRCATTAGRKFVVDAAVLVSKEVMGKRLPLSCIVFAYLQREGFAAGSELFVDSRRLKLDEVAAAEPSCPFTLTLGGPDELNKRVVDELCARRAG